MHKNINKIINTVLIGSMLGSNMSVFAIENNDNNALINEFGLNTLAENGEEVSEQNYEYRGPFTIDKDITLGSIPDVAVDLSLADDYAKFLVKKYLKPEGELMASDLVKVVGFSNGYLHIDEETKPSATNYQWLTLLPNLKSVELDVSKEISSGLDITILTSLNKLETLALHGQDQVEKPVLNNIEQLYSLGSTFEELTLSKMKGMDAIDFSKIVGLKNLSLIETTFTDDNQVLSTIPNSTTLKTLYITDLGEQSYVPYFINLESLDIYGLKKNIDFNSLTKLKSLYISGKFGDSTDINFDANNIKSLTNLEKLAIRPGKKSSIDNISSLESLINLRIIMLARIDSSVDNLNYNVYKSLETLNLYESDVTTLAKTTNLTLLKYLELSRTNVKDVSGLATAKYKNSLEYLSFGHKEVTLPNLDLVALLPNLTTISIDDIKVQNADGLFSHKNLKSIYLNNVTGVKELNISNSLAEKIWVMNYYDDNSKGSVEKITASKPNSTIKSLSVYNNILTDTNFVENLKGLTELSLSTNQITDISPIIKIYTQLEEEGLSLDRNFIPKAQMEQVKSKFDDSKQVTYTLAKKQDIEENDLNINENSPANLFKFGALYDEYDGSYSMIYDNEYKLEFILDDPRMGYVDSSFKLIPTRIGTITGTMKLYGDTSDRNSFKISFNSTVVENKGSIKVVYIDTDTKAEIASSTYLNGLDAGDVTVKAINIEGYTLVGNDTVVEKIDSNNLDKTVTFEYKKQEKKLGTVTINFVDDKTGEKIKEPKVIADLELNKFTYTADTIEGYTLVGNASQTVDITSENLNQSLEFRYAKVENNENKAEGSITIKYIDKDTKAEISKSEILSSLELKTHTVEAKAITGYKLVGENKVNVALTQENKSAEVVFSYNKDATVNTPAQETDYDVVATKANMEEAMNKKMGIDLIGDKITLSISYGNLSQVNNELSELGFNAIEDVSNKDTVLTLAKTLKLNVLDYFGVISNAKDLSKSIPVMISRKYDKVVDGKTFYLYKLDEKSRSSDLRYIGEVTYASGNFLFDIQSKELDGSTLVITNNRAASNETNNNTNSTVDKDESETIPDTSGFALLAKALSITGIAGAIVLLRKKKK